MSRMATLIPGKTPTFKLAPMDVINLLQHQRMLVAALCLVIALLIVRKWILRWSEKRHCAFGDLKTAGTPIPAHKKKKCAVIVGASISGILSARICADHFEKVVLIDAEDCTTDPNVKRKRVKQHEQLHLFLGLMYPALMKLFPGFIEEVKKAGGSVAPPQPVVYRGGGFVKVPLTADKWETRQLYISREVLEALLRRLVLERFPHVTAIHGNVTELNAQGDTVKSVALKRPDGTIENIEGELFLDCSGTANGSIGWLRKLGYNKPEKLTYDPQIVYSCFTFQMTPEMVQNFNKLGGPYTWEETGHLGACFSADHHSVFMKIDNDRVRTMYQTYVGRGGEPETPEDLLAAVKRAPYQDWQKEAIAMLCGEGMDKDPDYVMTRVTIGQCYRVTYQSKDMPRNMLPLGDSILRVNPIFGQGCTKSVIEILTLDNTLRKFAGKPTSRSMVDYYLDLRYARTDAFWEDTRLLDYACEDTKPLAGETAETGALYRRFKSWVVRAAQKDMRVGKTLTETMSALRPATVLYDPTFLMRCWLAHIFE